jgi:hypothetical protein
MDHEERDNYKFIISRLENEKENMKGKIANIIAFLGNVDYTRSVGPRAAQMYGDKLNDIQTLLKDVIK